MANKQFKVKGLEGIDNQVTPTTNITIEISPSVYGFFTTNTEVIFEINGVRTDWPMEDVLPAETYSFTPQELGLAVSNQPYELELSYEEQSKDEQGGDTLGSVIIKVVGIITPVDDPNTYILAPFVSKINKINLQKGEIQLESSWNDFQEDVALEPAVGAAPANIFRNAKISFKANEVRDLNTYVNFGDDNKTLITNLKADKELFPDSPYSIVLKLYKPLPDEIEEKDSLFVVTEVLPQLTETVELVPYEQEDENVNVLFTPDQVNVQSPISKRQIISKNKEDLIGADKKLQQEILDKFLSGSDKPVSMNVDYSNYEEFVNFSSIEKRLGNFKYKLEQIQSNTALSASSVSLSGGQSDAITYDNNIREIKRNFDGYESYLYNISSSFVTSSAESRLDTSVPKTGAGTFADPYLPVNTTSSLFTNWYGSSASRTGQIYSASLYDKENPNRLVNLLPEHISADFDNKQFLDFMDMVGQHFDELWLYIKSVTDITDRQYDISDGISTDLIFAVAKSLGWDTQDGKDLLELSRFGFGQKLTGDSYELYTSGSLDSPAEGDISKEITKRLISSMPYILKSKGTLGSLRAIMNCYGIPSSILRVREYGGLQLDNQKATFDIGRRFTRALGFRGAQYVETSWDDTSKGIKPETIEFRFRSVSGSDQILVQKDDQFAIKLKDNGSADNNGTVSFMLSGSDGYKEISSSLLPVFDGEYHSVMLRKSRIEAELFPHPSFEVGTNEGLFNPPFITGSNSAEFGRIEIVSSSNFARTGTKSLLHENTSDTNTSYTFFYRNPDANRFPGNSASITNVSEGQTYLFSAYCKASASLVDSVASLTLFELDSNEEVVSWTQEFENTNFDGGIKGSQRVGVNENEWKQIQVRKTIKFPNTTKLGIRFENNKPSSSIYWDDVSVRRVTANSDSIDDTFNYDLFVKKYDSGLDRIRLASKSNMIISSSVSESYNAAWTGSGDLFIGGNTTTPFSANKLSGSLMEFRLWSETLEEERFDVHVATPKSYIGNTPSSSYENIARRFSFDDNTTLAAGGFIRDVKPDQTNTQSGSAQGFGGVNTFETVIDKTKTLVPNHGPNRRMSDKIRIEDNYLSGSGANLSVSQRYDYSSNDTSPLDSNKLGIYFSPTDVINDDIVSSFANLDFNELIGDPRDVFSEEYSELSRESDKYFKKYTGNNNFFEYMSLIKKYDQNIFKQLRKVIPARAKANLGTLIESNIFERPKSPVQQSNPTVEQLDLRDTINVSVLEQESETSASIVSIESEFPNFESTITAGNDYVAKPALYKFATNFNLEDPTLYVNGSTSYGGSDSVFQEISGSIILDNRKSLINREFRYFYTSAADFDNSNIYSSDNLENLYSSRSLVETDLDTNYRDNTAFNNLFYAGVKNTRDTTIDGDSPVIVRRTAPTVAIPVDGVTSDLQVLDDK